eukprot:TRINITY_DN2720_c0_g3_i1.p1 TRINITY_DN2720_c0_g3~~TRINITY_DN2720_c0_g3_i1.p1  ORF type:complete len:253 (+),score=53.33 TRINITY_DN2720_c0_g3_i1:265-1023(+)
MSLDFEVSSSDGDADYKFAVGEAIPLRRVHVTDREVSEFWSARRQAAPLRVRRRQGRVRAELKRRNGGGEDKYAQYRDLWAVLSDLSSDGDGEGAALPPPAQATAAPPKRAPKPAPVPPAPKRPRIPAKPPPTRPKRRPPDRSAAVAGAQPVRDCVAAAVRKRKSMWLRAWGGEVGSLSGEVESACSLAEARAVSASVSELHASLQEYLKVSSKTELLHVYNNVKDAAQDMLGDLANLTGKSIRELQTQYLP